MREVTLRPRAYADLEGIWLYTDEQWGKEQTAVKKGKSVRRKSLLLSVLVPVLLGCSGQTVLSREESMKDEVLLRFVDDRGEPIQNAIIVGFSHELMDPSMSGSWGGPARYVFSPYSYVGVVDSHGRAFLDHRLVQSCKYLAVLGYGLNPTRIKDVRHGVVLQIPRSIPNQAREKRVASDGGRMTWHFVDDTGYPIQNAVIVGYNDENLDPARITSFKPTNLSTTFTPGYVWLGVVGSMGTVTLDREAIKACRYLSLAGEGYASTRIEAPEDGGEVQIPRSVTLVIARSLGSGEASLLDIYRDDRPLFLRMIVSSLGITLEGLSPGLYRWKIYSANPKEGGYRVGSSHLFPGSMQTIVMP